MDENVETMNNSTNDELKQISQQFAGLASIDLYAKLATLVEDIEAMQTRLEEVENLLDASEYSCKISSDNAKLDAICEHHLENLRSISAKIDAIESIVSARKQQVLMAKQRLDEAQETIGSTSNSTLKRILKLKPLFSP